MVTLRLAAPSALALGAVGCLMLAGCGGSGGGSDPPSASVAQRVSGFVWEQERSDAGGAEAPVAGATLQVQGTNIAVTTAGDGSYTVGPLSPGRSYDLLASADGYRFTVARILAKDATLYGPQVLLARTQAPVTIMNAAGGGASSNFTAEGNSAWLDVPPNALPGGAASASLTVTLMTGAAVPGALTDPARTVHPAVDVSLTGAAGPFARPVNLIFPLPFALTPGARLPVVRLEIDGRWAPAAVEAVVETGGKSAACSLAEPGTYGLSLPLQVSAAIVGSDRARIPGPYVDPVIVPVNRPIVTWSVQSLDAHAALTAAFVQGQRRGLIAVPGDLSAGSLVIHPRGSAVIEVVTSRLNLTAAGTGIGTPTGTVEGLAYHEFRLQ